MTATKSLGVGRKRIEDREAELVAVGDTVLDASGQDFMVMGFDDEFGIDEKPIILLTVKSVAGRGTEQWPLRPTQKVRVRNQPKEDDVKVSESETAARLTEKIDALKGSASKIIETHFIDVYPIYAPIPGVTLRVDRNGDTPARWLDVTIEQAEWLAEQLLDMVFEVSKDYVPKRGYQPEPKPSRVPLIWVVEDFDEIKEKWPVGNNKTDAYVYFETEAAALEIVNRLNDKNND